jgi:uncharacterized membrane protein YkvA (DUF1232 family)
MVPWRRSSRVKTERLREYARSLPQLIKLVARLARDPRVPSRTKTMLMLVGAYLLSPIDLVPSFVIGLGQLDDVIVVALALDQLLNHTPAHIVREHWDGEQDILELVQEILRVGTSVIPERVRKLFDRFFSRN